MRLYLRLAWRNVWRHRRRTMIVVLAIGLSTGLMLFYDGMIGGFEQAIYGNAIQVMGGNIQIHTDGYADEIDPNPLLPLEDDLTIVQAALAQPQVVAATRRINTGGMASSREGAFGVTIVGIEPEAELPISLIAQQIVEGRYLTADDQDMIFIGRGLAVAMDVGVGDRITLVGRATHSQMRNRTMTITGIYDVGMAEIEKRTIYMSLGEAQDLYGLNEQVTEVMVSLKQIGQEPAVMRALEPLLPGYEIVSWQTNMPELQQTIEMKSGIMDIFGVIILVIAGIGILNMLLMAVYERTREIGLLGALGMKPRHISNLFLLEGALIGLVGLAFGVVFGLIINITLGQIGLDYSQFTSITEYTALINERIYPTFGLEKIIQRTLTVVIIATLAAFLPAREAARNEPAEALHYV
jgi:ABC-type lipoprotein release transport system permease subunit